MTTRAATTYAETDGMPLPDGEYQSPLFRRIVGDIEEHFRDVPGAHVNGNTFLYYVEGNPRRSVSPDCYVVFGLSEVALRSLSLEGNNTYLLWEVGKAPDFVLEIGSGSTADADLGRKRDLYAELGVREYWRFDATGGEFYGEPLVGEYLQDGEYHRFELRHESDGRVWAHSDILNLDIWWTDGDLRFWDPVAERWMLRRDEERTGRRAAESRAENEQVGRLEAELRVSAADARAEEERARAEREVAARREAESRIAELEAELRRLRGE